VQSAAPKARIGENPPRFGPLDGLSTLRAVPPATQARSRTMPVRPGVMAVATAITPAATAITRSPCSRHPIHRQPSAEPQRPSPGHPAAVTRSTACRGPPRGRHHPSDPQPSAKLRMPSSPRGRGSGGLAHLAEGFAASRFERRRDRRHAGQSGGCGITCRSSRSSRLGEGCGLWWRGVTGPTLDQPAAGRGDREVRRGPRRARAGWRSQWSADYPRSH